MERAGEHEQIGHVVAWARDDPRVERALGVLEGELIAVDGNAIYPMKGKLFPIAMAQRADIRISMPKEGGAFPVLFRPEGVKERTGIVKEGERALFLTPEDLVLGEDGELYELLIGLDVAGDGSAQELVMPRERSLFD